MQFIWNQACEWLYPADVFSLRIASHYTQQSIPIETVYKNIKSIINQKLDLLMEPLFLEEMHYFRHWLSGSFLLQCLIGTIWENADIDFYFIADHNVNSMCKTDEDEFMHSFSESLDILEEPQVASYPGLPIFSYYYDVKHSNTRFNFNQIKIQTHMSVFEYTAKICDFAFTKNLYDGKNLFVYNWNSIIERNSNVVVKNLIQNIRQPDYQYCEKYYLHRCFSRMMKYKQRGFTLEFDSHQDRNLVYNHITRCNAKYHFDCECEPDPDCKNLDLGPLEPCGETQETQCNCPSEKNNHCEKYQEIDYHETVENCNHCDDKYDDDYWFAMMDKRKKKLFKKMRQIKKIH